MEILLLQDVAGIGRKNDLMVVGDGYALNFLLPMRKALVATPTVRKRYSLQIQKRAEEKEHDRKMREEASQALAGKSVTFARKAAKNGKLYESIHVDDISKALGDQHSVNVPSDKIHMSEHIKTTGAHPVSIKIGDTTLTITVVVNAEK